MSDGGLRSLFQKHLPLAHWQAIESWNTGQGVPDSNGCLEGVEFWIEHKATVGWTVGVSPGQVAWLERRTRHGGRCFVAVRRQGSARGISRDELYLFLGVQARSLLLMGLKGTKPLGMWEHGPSRWAWGEVKSFLINGGE